MSVSGTYRPPKSRSIPQRPCSVRLEQAGMDRRRAEGEVGAVVARGAGALGEEGHEVRVLARPLPGLARQLHARGDVHAGRRDVAQRARDVPGASPPARVTGTSRATAAASATDARWPVPPGWGPPAVSRRRRSTPPAR